MSAWLKDNGAATEKALLEWKSIPTAVSPKLDRADARRGNTRDLTELEQRPIGLAFCANGGGAPAAGVTLSVTPAMTRKL